MPTQTFFHLPEEKQKRLLEAARIEFSSASLNEASIAKIVKLADIPRGSFYQYFENKEDLYFYYLANLKKNSHIELIQAIRDANGDVFAGFETFFPIMLHEIVNGENAAFYQKLFTNMDFHSSDRMMPMFANDKTMKKNMRPHHPPKHGKLSIVEAIDLSKLKVSSHREMGMLMELLMISVFSSIGHVYKDIELGKEEGVNKAVEDFQTKLNWLRDGAKK